MYCTRHVTVDNEVIYEIHSTYAEAVAFAHDVLESEAGGHVEYFARYGGPLHAEDLTSPRDDRERRMA